MIPPSLRRHAIGVIALILLLGAMAFWLSPSEGERYLALEAACWRVGALMVVLWIAYPDVHRMPPWLLFAIPVLVVILAVRPRLFLLAIPVLIALAILGPGLKAKR